MSSKISVFPKSSLRGYVVSCQYPLKLIEDYVSLAGVPLPSGYFSLIDLAQETSSKSQIVSENLQKKVISAKHTPILAQKVGKPILISFHIDTCRVVERIRAKLQHQKLKKQSLLK